MEKQNTNHNKQRKLLAATLSGKLILSGMLVVGYAEAAPDIQHPAAVIISTGEEPMPRLALRPTLPHNVSLPKAMAKPRSHSESKVVKQKPVAQIHHSRPEQSSTEKADSARLDWLKALRVCESGGNYQDDTGNGYYGAYQFSAGTWDSLHTGYASANEAPPAVQDRAIIENTERSSGGLATQNPGCYEKEHLSQFPPQ